MLLNYEELSPVKKVVEVEIPAADVDAALRAVTSEFARNAKIPGFRPGKTPPEVVRSRFSKEIAEEALNRLLPDSFRDAVVSKGLTPVGDPRLLERVDILFEGQPIKYRAEFEVKPEITLREYRGLEIDEQKVDITEADVDAMIERIREQASSYRPESERGAGTDDFVMIDIASSGEGFEPKSESGHVRIGEETPLPELHEAIRGKKVGEQGSFEKTYDDSATNDVYRGKRVRHDVTVKEIRVQEKPEVTDDFARSFGGWESVAEMREKIRADIVKHREAEAVRARKSQIGERLLQSHHFDVPDVLVEEEIEKSLQNYARFLASQGVDVEKAELDWNKMHEEFRPEAVKRVRRSLVLEAIARAENLAATDTEVDAEIRRAATENQREFADVKHRLKHEGGYESLRLSLSQEKALDLILREAKTIPAGAA